MAIDDVTSAEQRRLEECRSGVLWKRWGPYLSERQWGTVREDYSQDGDAWSYFSHDQARSRAYRWGEDGIAGLSDEKQRLCLALALWNEQDPILKERLFGVTNSEGNHGEDVKECYFYVDATPTHSYATYLYKYPQAAYPYEDLVKTNRGRSRFEMEYELLDTGVFDDDRYFDVTVEHTKADPEDVVIRITAANRGPDDAPLHLLPTLWFRNTWSWGDDVPKPSVRAMEGPDGVSVVRASHHELGQRWLLCDGAPELLFCENETNTERLWGTPNATEHPKDSFHRYVVNGDAAAVSPDKEGTKAAAHYRLVVPAGGEVTVRLRLTASFPAAGSQPFADVPAIAAARQAEADAFYDKVLGSTYEADRATVRQALAGMLWSKQYYSFDLARWLEEHDAHPLLGGRRSSRNQGWYHMVNDDIISMPDKWEYPWYAAWDLAFHTIPLNMVDPDFAREQLLLMLSEVYLHPTGQIPAYEWNFGDVNPPVHAWATLLSHQLAGRARGERTFLEEAFHKLLLNFTWWVNRKDPSGKNVFEGGFLGLDNIGVFDRSSALPTGGRLEQADGTAWMAMFSQNMLEITLELIDHDPTYEDMALKFIQHFFLIAASMDRVGEHADELWDEEDGFFYDVLRLPDGTAMRLKVRSLVGILPMCAVTIIPPTVVNRHRRLTERVTELFERNREVLVNIHDPSKPGNSGRLMLSVLNERKLRAMLTRILDEERFLSPHGIRSISRWHLDHPFEFDVHGEKFVVKYEPAESTTGMFGGNSNWRGPVWIPINVLIVRALLAYHLYYGDSFTIECPTGSGNLMTLREVAAELTRRLVSIFRVGDDGQRPVYGGTTKLQDDPHWNELLLFYEYFHGDNGAGLGASHQTGWTGVVAFLARILPTLEGDDDILTSGLGVLRSLMASIDRVVDPR